MTSRLSTIPPPTSHVYRHHGGLIFDYLKTKKIWHNISYCSLMTMRGARSHIVQRLILRRWMYDLLERNPLMHSSFRCDSTYSKIYLPEVSPPQGKRCRVGGEATRSPQFLNARRQVSVLPSRGLGSRS